MPGVMSVQRNLVRLIVAGLRLFDISYIVWSRFGPLTPFVLLPAHIARSTATTGVARRSAESPVQ